MFSEWAGIIGHWVLLAVLFSFFIGLAAYFMGLITGVPRWAKVAVVGFLIVIGALTILSVLL